MNGAIGEQLTGRKALHIPVAAATRIVKGDFIVIDADGNAALASKATGLVNAGQAVSDADNTSGEAGDVYVDAERGVYIYGNAGDITENDLLKECYFAGPDSVSLEGETTSSVAGIVVAVGAGIVAVDML